MDVFFTFIDKINKPIFVLYDKNFIHLNMYLLSSLGFTDKNRPGSLTQIMEPKWKTRLIALKPDEEIYIPLIMNGGKIQKYRVRMHQLEIEKSEYICFILNVKEATDQIIEIANRIITRIPLPAFTFDSGMNFLQLNDTFKDLDEIKPKSLDGIKNLFKMNENPDFSKQELFLYKSTCGNLELFLFKPLPEMSFNYYCGVIAKKTQLEKNIDVNYVKNSISQTIQYLTQVQKLYENQNSVTQVIWNNLHNEIINLSQVKRHLEYETTLTYDDGNEHINLNKLIINELEILKSNDFFRQYVNLETQFDNNLHLLKLKYSDLKGSLISIIRHITEHTCLSENNEFCIESAEEDELIWLKMSIKSDSLTKNQKSELHKNLEKYEKQFVDGDVIFVCKYDSQNNINLRIGFEK